MIVGVSRQNSDYWLAFQASGNRPRIQSVISVSAKLVEETFHVTSQPKINELKRRHVSLDEAIEGEAHRPSPDQTAIAEMKKQKLRLKKEITVMENT